MHNVSANEEINDYVVMCLVFCYSKAGDFCGLEMASFARRWIIPQKKEKKKIIIKTCDIVFKLELGPCDLVSSVSSRWFIFDPKNTRVRIKSFDFCVLRLV